MKTYKHKKTGETMTYKDGLMMVDRCVIEGKPDSDFWEEVVEKNYKILEWSNPASNCFECSLRQVDSTWIIKSVKRLSDGEIFTVDDFYNKKRDYTYGGKMTKFKIHEIKLSEVHGITFTYYRRESVYNAHLLSDNLTKISKIFTTEDSVDIFKGDFCCVVSKNYNRYPAVCTYVVDNESIFHRPDANYYFSTTNAASEFLKLNTKLLSILDVMDTIRDGNTGAHGHPGFGLPDYLIDNIQSALEKIKL
tara:strand:+ start:3442 stop:4188 length:747 start_codon:yes stop_codon:yes gene_type:complete